MKQLELDDLAKFLTEDRKKRIEDVLSNRTRAISILLEDIYQGHNISAVLRTCDNLGVQDVHIFQDVNKTPLSKGISLGSEKWISLHIKDRKMSKKVYIDNLKKEGYKIISTVSSSKKGSINLETTKFPKKIILAFGNEEKGLTKEILNNSDFFLTVPMHGFTQSYNISVCCAIVLSKIVSLLKTQNKFVPLADKDKKKLRLDWYRKSIKNSKTIIKNLTK